MEDNRAGLVPCQTDGDVSPVVMPAEAGIQKSWGWILDSRLRGNDAVTVRHQLHIDELLDLPFGQIWREIPDCVTLWG
jgi:hypothetical protein